MSFPQQHGNPIDLPGQDTLIAGWTALAPLSPGTQVIRTTDAVAAVFPSWAPLNNAILDVFDGGRAAETVERLAAEYAAAGVDHWAVWVPSRIARFDWPDRGHPVAGFTRDETTLVMRMRIPRGLPRHPGVVRTSIDPASRAGDEPVPAATLPAADERPGLKAWVMVDGDVAVASTWSFLHGDDCGISAVGTAPGWRRRGLARAVVEHALADAFDQGARTASLQSTPMGQPLYEAIGFESVGRYEEWVPAGARQTV